MPNTLETQLLLCGRESNDKAVDSGLDLSPGCVVMVTLPNPAMLSISWFLDVT